MRDALALYARYLGISARAQLQYRASFALQTVGQFAITSIEFLGLWALFDRFGSLASWRLAEVAFFYGVVNVSFALAESVTTGLDHLGELVRRGEFDRMLLRPRSAVLQLVAYELSLRRIGRLLQGAVVLAAAGLALDLDWSLAKAALFTATLAGGLCMFFGLFLAGATLSFWTIETLELLNTLTYGGVETAQYPLAIYAAWFRRFFTFVVPLAAIAYFPVVALLGRPDPLGSPLWFQHAAPLLGGLFLLGSLGFFRLGLRRYASTGS
jgi:ABC-2 type transport system permease protein